MLSSVFAFREGQAPDTANLLLLLQVVLLLGTPLLRLHILLLHLANTAPACACQGLASKVATFWRDVCVRVLCKDPLNDIVHLAAAPAASLAAPADLLLLLLIWCCC
jgi:hypothetical protein